MLASTVKSESHTHSHLTAWTAIVFAVGLAFTWIYWSRSQVAGDQLNMLARGWLLMAEGEWIPFGLGTSAGGKAPGGLTSLIVGLPLMVWQNHRAPTLVIVLLNLVGYFLLDRLVARELGPQARLLFAIVYWLNPWRLYHSGFLWNSSYLLPLGALHFWTVYRQRERPRFGESFLQVLVVGLAAQLHPAAATLVILSVLLWWRGYFRFHWPAVALASILIAASLIPWALAIIERWAPAAFEHQPARADRPIPALHGSGSGLLDSVLGTDWQQHHSLSRLRLAFQSLRGRHPATRDSGSVGLLTLPVVIWGNLRLWRGSKGWWRRVAGPIDFRTWLLGVVRWSFVGVLAACVITPTAVMSWQLLSVLHLAVLPLVLLGLDLIERGRWTAVRLGATAYAAIGTVLIAAIGWGSPMFRCGGETCDAMNATPPPLRANHEMLDELGINDTCPYEVDVPGGWWPDVLPEH